MSLIGALLLAPASASATQPAASAAEIAPGGIVKAADLSQFQPGNIISDAVFLDKDTMSEWQIQAFLESKMPSCRSGYTCLKDYFDTSRATSADPMCAAYPGGYRERASTIIYKVAQACGINPQVILVMLQKEQGLVLSSAPSKDNYLAAMGQACPDTAACDARYLGFFNQVFGGAWQLKRYSNPPGTSQYFTWYAPGKTWNVRWHPNAACGSSPVYIQNQATANLYYYTPYQPNAAALRAGYNASSDPCASYGNRNFYQFFTDWFGSTQIAGAPPVLSSLNTDAHVISLDAAGTLWAYPHSTTGRWGTRVQIGNGFANVRGLLPIGDLDGDGNRDLVVSFTDGAVILYRGNGATGYASATTLGARWADARMVATAGDFDGDNEPDAFTVTPSGELLLWRGRGGEFRAPKVVGAGWSGMNLITGGTDVDGDGHPDVIARDLSGNLFLYAGDGAGGWKASSLIGIGWGAMSMVFSPGDFTGDGVADVLARDGSGRLWRYAGNRAGMLGGAAQVGVGWDSMQALAASGPPPGVRVMAPGVGDISGDRAADIPAQTQSGDIVAYFGNDAGAWNGWRTVLTGWSSTDRLVPMGDFDRDGHRDVARITADGTFSLHRGVKGGFSDQAAVIGTGWGQLDKLVGSVDFNGDRNADVLAVTQNGDMLLYRGDGRGGWLGGPVTVGYGWGSFTAVVYAGDFDGDDAGDIVARAADGGLWLYPTNGAGGWKTPRLIGVGWAGLTAIVGPGDFDGSGGPDIIARSGGDLLLYRGDGRGGWLGSRVIGVGWQSMQRIV